MTTTLIPIPDDAYERSNLLFSLKKAITLPCAELKDTGHWLIQYTQKSEASFHSKTAKPSFRNMNVDYGKVRSRAQVVVLWLVPYPCRNLFHARLPRT